jgi:hypothetical protein
MAAASIVRLGRSQIPYRGAYWRFSASTDFLFPTSKQASSLLSSIISRRSNVTQLQGVNILTEGPSGTGKTYALRTLVEWCDKQQIEVFVLFTESGLETLLGAWADRNVEIPKNLHWHVMQTKPIGLAGLVSAADNVGKLTYESITKMSDPTRHLNNAFHGILAACSNFPDDRTGTQFGAVDTWLPNRVFVIDGLTELSNAAMKMVIGNKPTAAPPDYGVAQNNLMNFLRLCTQGIPCHFILIAHVSREKDEISGGIRLMTKAIGAAISGDIPPLFSDVIYTVREGSNFFWDTASSMVDVKTRNLPIQSKLSPDYSPIMEKWKARNSASARPTPAVSK